MKNVERAFYAIKKTKQVGRMTVGMLSQAPGWDNASASRYRAFLARSGWLEKVSETGYPVYVLGREVMELAPDFRL